MSFINALIFGFLGALGALVFEIVVRSSVSINLDASSLAGFLLLGGTLLLFAAIEEIFKAVLLSRHFFRFPHCTIKQTLFSGLGLGLGFGGIELTFIATTQTDTPLLPMVGILVVHLATAIFLAFFLSKPKDSRMFPFSIILLLAITVHFLYNLVTALSSLSSLR